MHRNCPSCNQRNPLDAHYCSNCGAALSNASIATHAAPGAGLRSLALWGCGFAVIASATLIFQAAGDGGGPTEATVRRDYVLGSDKADAIFDMIAPRDVRVVVGRHENGLYFEGAPGEVAIITQFIELVTRLDGHHAVGARMQMNRLRPTWAVEETYKLSRRHAAALRCVLSFDDVPVLVSGKSKQVRVRAAPEDQKTVGHMVRILRGKRHP